VHVEGITGLASADIDYAESLGYRIKLLGITRRRPDGIELRVHPALIPAKRLIANVDGSMNGIMVRSDAAGVTMYYGAGAGSEETASAIIADLVDITRLATADPEHRVPYLAFQPAAMADTPILPMSEVVTSYYLRMRVADQPGVMADITRILADASISIESMLQKGPAEGDASADIVMLTHQALEKNIDAALGRIEALPTVAGKVVRLRIERLG
jgi:homoserine dehydrogenase